METPLPNDYLASKSPPVRGCLRFFRRDWLKAKCSNNVLNIITNSYILPFIRELKLARHPQILSGYKAHQKDLALASCIQSPEQERNRKVGKRKVSWVLQSPVSSFQASSKLKKSDRPQQGQHLSSSRKVQNGKTRVHQGLS